MMAYALVSAILPLLALAQDGVINGPTTSSSALGYSCDSIKCQLPDCACASTTPPGGLQLSQVPQFVVFTADDAIQSYTLDAINQFLAKRKNPNGCDIKMTYFTSLDYTNYTLVTDWFVAGNEIADHTMTHVGTPSAAEINGNVIALNALAGIPLSEIQGFRAPFLNYSVDTLKLLAQAKFTYDSSAVSSIPVTDPNTDAYWPYTLDNGMANNCLSVPGTCRGEPKLPGFWEIPMYAFFDSRGVDGPHLMDPWLDPANGDSAVNDNATLAYMKNTFTAHYSNNRQPIGLYTHPIHLSTTYPGVNPSNSTIAMINEFLDWAQEQQDVWIISNRQLLDWVRYPVPAAQLNSIPSFQCTPPQVAESEKICNGIPQNEEGLLSHCPFPDFPFYTCYGCPTVKPSPSDPNPPQDLSNGQTQRYRLPTNCSTAFWDPIGGKCLCSTTACNFDDDSRPIGPNGANLTGGGIGGNFDPEGTKPEASYIPFNGAAPPSTVPTGAWPALLLGCIGAFLGTFGVFSRV